MRCDDVSQVDFELRHPERTRNCALEISDCSREPEPRNPQSPLRVMFVQTDMRVGGAEMITANIIRRLDRRRFAPELCCLKERGRWVNPLPMRFPFIMACSLENTICEFGRG